MGEKSRRLKIRVRKLAEDFCVHHPTRQDVEAEAARFERFFRDGLLIVEKEPAK